MATSTLQDDDTELILESCYSEDKGVETEQEEKHQMQEVQLSSSPSPQQPQQPQQEQQLSTGNCPLKLEIPGVSRN
jgi:hypothetical protein